MSADALLSIVELARRLDGDSKRQSSVSARRGPTVDSTSNQIEVTNKEEEESGQETAGVLSGRVGGQDVSKSGPNLRQRAAGNRKGSAVE
ncbi:X protein [Loveridge's garter snake virus 1]|uniref:X protein n=1 Tax=Loveridge's garter snake virus 1 TaxID=1881951 RepID=A0A077EML6_9MONO|nr:X protein [Loveridge's garter snake virus 1]AIL50415.1 X protein [Loveridge's garter snake virus 1]